MQTILLTALLVCDISLSDILIFRSLNSVVRTTLHCSREICRCRRRCSVSSSSSARHFDV